MKKLIGFDRLCHSLPLLLFVIAAGACVYLVSAGLTRVIRREDIPARVRKLLRIP